MSDLFILNVNPDGSDVVHRNPREECNTDDAKGRERIDQATAEALIDHGAAVRCGHCNTEEAHL